MTLLRPSERCSRRGVAAEFVARGRDNPPRGLGGGRYGFTLLEALLAISVTAVLLAAISGILFTAFRVRNGVTDTIERAEPLERTLAIIRQDLSNLVLPGGVMSGTFQTAPLQSTSQSTNASTGPSTVQLSALLSQNPPGQAGRSSPLFYVAVGQVDETSPFADIEQVYYFLAPPANNGRGLDLYRAVTRNLLPVMNEDPTRQLLMGGVDSINFEFWSPGTIQVGQWLDYWDSTNPDPMTEQTNNVPQAIRMTIQLVAPNGAVAAGAPVQLVVPVSVQASTNQASSY